jgi:hypothetical protein
MRLLIYNHFLGWLHTMPLPVQGRAGEAINEESKMVREFFYGGDRFRATVHGRQGKEEIFIVQVLEDDEEGNEISIDRFEDAGNDPEAPLESVLTMLVDRMRGEFDLKPQTPGAAFNWSEGRVLARVHSGVQH